MSKTKNAESTESTEMEIPSTPAPVKVTKTYAMLGDAPYRRVYKFVAMPPLAPKGKQRLYTLNALQQLGSGTVKEIAKLTAEFGLTSVTGVETSTAWHLHHLVKLGYAEIVIPSSEKAA